jgi:serine/threonine protein kinase
VWEKTPFNFNRIIKELKTVGKGLYLPYSNKIKKFDLAQNVEAKKNENEKDCVTPLKELWENRKTQPLGQGTYGTVYETHDSDGKKYIIKVFKSAARQKT